MASIIVLALGDIIGQPGRQALAQHLPTLRSQLQPDIVVANGENLAGGFGLTEPLIQQLTGDMGIDALTTGNHWADQQAIKEFGPRYPQVILPANAVDVRSVERGFYLGKTTGGVPYAVINLQGRVFMHGKNECPFQYADRILHAIGDRAKIKILDIHAEATSEKQALAHYLSGRVSLVYGTHTHCPTADERILDGRTGFITDVGMTGAYDSVAGMRKEQSLRYFLTGEKQKYQPSSLDLWLCAIAARLDPATGACTRIARLRLDANAQHFVLEL